MGEERKVGDYVQVTCRQRCTRTAKSNYIHFEDPQGDLKQREDWRYVEGVDGSKETERMFSLRMSSSTAA